ncbi:MAG: pseudouridine-5'-phosphate glycosidase [Geminicoccaceae bacterium]
MPYDVAPEVASALADGAPVVALETTLICHGLPRPRNLAVAFALEAAVRAEGAVPATVALMDGRIRVGLSSDELTRLANADDVQKCAPREFALVLGRRGLGATTVAGTIRAAAAIGIRFMATGGIGGVHRGGEDSLDISADLPELARSSVAVVCSGAKVILDLPRTLEVLETLGVPVIGYETGEFPAFYCAGSGLPVPRVDGTAAAAELLAAHAALGWPSGLVVGNPPPVEFAMERGEVEALLSSALAEARRSGIKGQAETPFLLRQLALATKGRSVRLNEALVEANATLAARLARHFAQNMHQPGKTLPKG